MSVLQQGSSGAAVETVQRQLNCCNPTRLPRLVPDGVYGVATMTRVMEYQSQHRLLTDGKVGPNTSRSLGGTPAACTNAAAPSGRCIVVDLIHNRLTAYLNGLQQLMVQPIRGGRPGAESDRGVFQMSSRRLRHHTSSVYPTPPDNMQFSLFYNRGEAIHQGSAAVASHGCIHVPAPYAEQVFNFAGSFDVIVIGVDGFSRATYEGIRIGGNRDKAIENEPKGRSPQHERTKTMPATSK